MIGDPPAAEREHGDAARPGGFPLLIPAVVAKRRLPVCTSRNEAPALVRTQDLGLEEGGHPASCPRYHVDSGGIVIAPSAASISTTASTSARSKALTYRSTISRRPWSSSERSIACWLRSERRSSTASWARCNALSTPVGVVFSVAATSRAEKPEHIAEDEHGALARGQVLERRDEGETDALALLVARLRTGEPVEAEHLVGIGLHPDRLDQGLAEAVVGIGRGGVVDRKHPLGPALDRPQAGVPRRHRHRAGTTGR